MWICCLKAIPVPGMRAVTAGPWGPTVKRRGPAPTEVLIQRGENVKRTPGIGLKLFLKRHPMLTPPVVCEDRRLTFRSAAAKPPAGMGVGRCLSPRISVDRQPQISIRSLPTIIWPLKCLRTPSDHMSSVMSGSSPGTRCDNTTVLTWACAATLPTSSGTV